ncbi:MAG TPA: ribosome biogenesis GTPase Der [Candidatus Magasanikbacteria bacterium]|nr:ribosome biogenesis GTPase Der [Candidatus Magasanikbacteria bacterium]
MATPAKIIEQNLPTVALVGRVNVGKSTLFNKITETAHALVSNIPGTTRTRNIGIASWRGKQFRLIDTGGLTFDESVPLEKEIIAQTEIALNEADVIVFVVDIQDELLPQEKELARRLRQKEKNKPVILVANKADNAAFRSRAYEEQWLKLGLGEPIPVSAGNGSNVGDFLDLLYKQFNKTKIRPKQEKNLNPIKVALIGKPNVGKSTLFNSLIGEERVIVSEMPHTTREPHDILVEAEDQAMLFVDTAGIRRKTKVSGELERIGIGKSLDAINKADIVLFLLDAGEPITDQDQQLGGFLKEHTKSTIIVINKWDKAEANDDEFRGEVKQLIYNNFPHLDFAPVVFVSAKSQYRVHQIFPLIKQAYEARQITLDDATLKEFLKNTTHKRMPTTGKGVRHPKILSLKQLASNPPVFELMIKVKTSLHNSYIQYLKKRLREKFGFFATPLIIKVSKLKQLAFNKQERKAGEKPVRKRKFVRTAQRYR